MKHVLHQQSLYYFRTYNISEFKKKQHLFCSSDFYTDQLDFFLAFESSYLRN